MSSNNSTPIITISIYYVLCLILHEDVEKPFEWFVANYGNERLSLILNIFFGTAFLATILFVLNKIKSLKERKGLGLMWVITLMLSYAGYYILMPYKSEGIHFLQYSILGFLCYWAVGRSWPALMMAYMLGIGDELYQYIFGGSVYVDFNDMVLNFLGSAIGVLLYITFKEQREVIDIDTSKNLGWKLFSGLGTFLITSLILYFLGVICIYADDGCNYSIIKWERGRLSYDFWDCTDWGKCWHRVKAWEGISFLSILPLIYFVLFRISGKLDANV